MAKNKENTIDSPEKEKVPTEEIAETIGETPTEQAAPAVPDNYAVDENGEIIAKTEDGQKISNPMFADEAEIKSLPMATVTITKDLRTDRKTGVKRATYTASLVLDRITSIPLPIGEAEYGLIAAESGRSFVPLQFSYKVHCRFVKTIFENGNSQLRVDAFLSDEVRVSSLIDQRSFVGKLYLKRVAQGAIPEELHPMVRYAVKKAE